MIKQTINILNIQFDNESQSDENDTNVSISQPYQFRAMGTHRIHNEVITKNYLKQNETVEDEYQYEQKTKNINVNMMVKQNQNEKFQNIVAKTCRQFGKKRKFVKRSNLFEFSQQEDHNISLRENEQNFNQNKNETRQAFILMQIINIVKLHSFPWYDYEGFQTQNGIRNKCKKVLKWMTFQYQIFQQIDGNQNLMLKVKPDSHKNLFNIYDYSQKYRFKNQRLKMTFRVQNNFSQKQMTVYTLNSGSKFSDLVGTALQNQLNFQSIYELNRKHIKIYKSTKLFQEQKVLNNLKISQKTQQNASFILEDDKNNKILQLFANKNKQLAINKQCSLPSAIAFALIAPQLYNDLQ